MEWVIVVPVKELAVAKTRLAELGDAVRADLALAMACDVVTAALACPSVVDVVAVTNDARATAALSALGARLVADGSDAGLDQALLDGARLGRVWHPRAGIAAVAADLPCATPTDLAAVLDLAAASDHAVLADAGGGGTTVLTARSGVELAPQFGAASRHRHVIAGATALPDDWPHLARDVDTVADLRAALVLGVGPATAALDMLRACRER